jgi:hypothetical protein
VEFKTLRAGQQSIPWFFQEDTWRFEENCGSKSSLIPNHYRSCQQSRGHERPPPKVISRGGLSEKELMLSTLRFHRRAKGKVVSAITPTPRCRKGLCLDA